MSQAGLIEKYVELDPALIHTRFRERLFDWNRHRLRPCCVGSSAQRGVPTWTDHLSFSSSSWDLLGQVQFLLLGFGIASRRWNDGADFMLRIDGASRSIFEREIGFFSSSKTGRGDVDLPQSDLTDTLEAIERLGEEEVFDLTSLSPATSSPTDCWSTTARVRLLDDTACNLASINLMKFLGDDGSFDIEGYRHANRVFFWRRRSWSTRLVSDGEDLPALARVPPARPRLREPGHAAHGAGSPLRQRRGPRLRPRA